MFIDKISRKTTQFLIEKDIIEFNKFDIYLYGLQLFYSTTLKSIGLIIIAMFLGYVKEAILFVCFFTVLRTYIGGYHSSSYLNCFIATALCIFPTIKISYLITDKISIYHIIILLFISIVLIGLFAPVDSPNKPLSDKEKIKYKKIGLRIVLIESLLIIICSVYNNLLIYSFITTIAVLIASISLINKKSILKLINLKSIKEV